MESQPKDVGAAVVEADVEEPAPAVPMLSWRAFLGARSTQVLGPFAIYLVASTLLFGLRVLPHPSTRYFGWGVDPSSIVWFLRWWPYALVHGMNPFVTHLVWAPTGANLAGTTSIPGVSLVASPLTLTLGPIVTYNLLYLVTPALSAWTAYLLCRHVTRSLFPSLVGGYLFGFSSYELTKLLGHLNLAMVFLIPVCVLLVLLRVEGRIGRLRFVLLLAAALSFQFLVSTEVFFTMSLFGALAFLVALPMVQRGLRPTMMATAGWILVSYGVAAVALAPYLFYVLKGISQAPIYDFYPTLYSSDLLNLVVPTTLTRVGWETFAGVAGKFTGNLGEQGAYLGLPLLAIIVLFAWRERRTLAGKLIPIVLAIVGLATLGPKLHVEGRETVALPWKPLSSLPLFKYALPGRFMVYAFLAVGVLVSLWLASARTWGWAKWTLVPAAIVFLLPNWRASFWNSPVNVPSFFKDGVYRRYLAPGENVIVLPYGDHGHSMLWQEQTGMYFRMAGGYVTVVAPKEFRALPILPALYGGDLPFHAEEQLKAFVGSHDVRAVIVADLLAGSESTALGRLLLSLDPHPVLAGDVLLYRVPERVLRTYAHATSPIG